MSWKKRNNDEKNYENEKKPQVRDAQLEEQPLDAVEEEASTPGVDDEAQPAGEERGEEQEEKGEERLPTEEEYASLQGELEETRRKNEELSEALVRLRADFDNFRRRTLAERGKIAREALAEFMQELLPVIDNLERALDAARNSSQASSTLLEGVEMIHKQLLQVMKKSGVEQIEAEGQSFDPNLHEAVAKEENEDCEPNIVIEELQKGYKLKERVLRPSRVKISSE